MRLEHDPVLRSVFVYPEGEREIAKIRGRKWPWPFNRGAGAFEVPEAAVHGLQGLSPEAGDLVKRLSRPRFGDPLSLCWLPEGMHLYPHQLREVPNLVAGPYGLLWDCGIGKGLLPHTPVLTTRGWKPIGQLSIQKDQVFASDGWAYPVTGIHYRGTRAVYRITFSDGSSTVCDGDHLWIVRTGNDKARGNPWRVLSTDALIETNLHYGKQQSRTWEIPLCQPVQFPKKNLPVHPYILGVLIGDGSLTQAGVNWCKEDTEIADRVRSFLPPGLEVRRKDSPDRTTVWAIARVGGVGQHPIAAALKGLGLRVRSHERSIPPDYLLSSVEDRLLLLQGLMDTDGSASGAAEYSTSSRLLAEQVVSLVQSLGGIASLAARATRYTHLREKRQGRESYRVIVSLPEGLPPFSLPRKAVAYKHPTRGLGRWIDSIECAGAEKTVCISVGSPDKSFITEHHLVTHNTVAVLSALHVLRTCGHVDGLIVVGPGAAETIWTEPRSRKGDSRADSAPLSDTKRFLGLTGRVIDRRASEAILGGLERVEHEGVLFLTYAKVFRAPYFEAVTRLLQSGRWALCMDEAHLCSGHLSRRWSVLDLWGRITRWRWALTGTPMKNHLDSYWPMYRFVTGATVGREEFLRWFVHGPLDILPRKWNETHMAQFGQVLRQDFSRVTKRDAAPWLPPKTTQAMLVPLRGRQRELYGEAVRQEKVLTRQPGAWGRAEAHASFGRMQRLLSLASHPGIIGEPVSEGDLAKLDAVRDLLDMAGEQKVCVWSWHPKTLDMLERCLGETCVVYHGEKSTAEKAEAVSRFKSGGARVFLGNPAAAGTALSLGEATVSIFWDLSWAWDEFWQAGERNNRITRTEPLTEYVLIGQGTIEEVVWEKVQHKIDMQALVFSEDPGKRILSAWSREHAQEVLDLWR